MEIICQDLTLGNFKKTITIQNILIRSVPIFLLALSTTKRPPQDTEIVSYRTFIKMLNYPTEILGQVIGYLSPVDKIRLALTCRDLYAQVLEGEGKEKLCEFGPTARQNEHIFSLSRTLPLICQIQHSRNVDFSHTIYSKKVGKTTKCAVSGRSLPGTQVPHYYRL